MIEAARTKPFGFMPFYPGPGLGGHCIPVDPFYLSWKARQSGFECRFIELARHVNSSMPEVVDRVAEALNSARKSINGSSIHLFGVAYKEDVGDFASRRRLISSSFCIGVVPEISYTNPFAPSLKLGEITLESTNPHVD